MDEIKKRHFKKVYDNAETIECKCGCKQTLKNKDKYGRNKEYINGHNGRKYEDPKQFKREWNKRNRKSIYKNKCKRIKRIKSEFILLNNGKCNKCGLKYDYTNGSMFDFHHIIPSEKSFTLNQGTIGNKSLKDLNEEVKKCKLLCSNCHRLEHSIPF